MGCRNHLDIDVRHAVQVKIVHGSWKKEDPHRISIEVRRLHQTKSMHLNRVSRTTALSCNLLKALLTSREPGAIREMAKRSTHYRSYAGAIWHSSLQDDGASPPRRHCRGHHSHCKHDTPRLDQHEPSDLAVGCIASATGSSGQCTTRSSTCRLRSAIQVRSAAIFGCLPEPVA